MKPQVPYGSSGTRLRPLSDTSPGRLIPAAGRPVLVHVPKNLREPGAEEIGVIAGARREAIETVPGDDGSASGPHIARIPQEAPLGLSESAAGPSVRRLRLGAGRPVVRDSRVDPRTPIGAGYVVEAADSADSLLLPGAGVRRIGAVRGSVLARESAAGPAVRRIRLPAGRPAWVRAVVARTVVARTVVRKTVGRRILGVVGTDPDGRVTWVVEESRDPAASPLRLAVGRPVWLEAAA